MAGTKYTPDINLAQILTGVINVFITNAEAAANVDITQLPGIGSDLQDSLLKKEFMNEHQMWTSLSFQGSDLQ